MASQPDWSRRPRIEASLHHRVVAARRDNQTGVEQALAGIWQGRLQELLLDEPDLANELCGILDGVLTPMLTPAERARVGRITMTGQSHDSSTFNQVVGDQHNIHP